MKYYLDGTPNHEYFQTSLITAYFKTEEGRIKVHEAVEEICPERMISTVMQQVSNGTIRFYREDDITGIGTLSCDELLKVANYLEPDWEDANFVITVPVIGVVASQARPVYLEHTPARYPPYRWVNFTKYATKFSSRQEAKLYADQCKIQEYVIRTTDL